MANDANGNKNGWGGARSGAGRKPKEKPDNTPVTQPEGTDMLTLLQNVALGVTEATPLQVRAAIAAVQYTHTKRADGGKKEEQKKAADGVASIFGLRGQRLQSVK